MRESAAVYRSWERPDPPPDRKAALGPAAPAYGSMLAGMRKPARYANFSSRILSPKRFSIRATATSHCTSGIGKGHAVSTIKYFEDFVVGEEHDSGHEYVVTIDELKEMATQWDPQPFHLDENAPETKEYGGLITCSAHTFAIYSYLGSKSPVKTAAIASLGFNHMKMILPLRPGDRIRAANVCLEKRESRTKPDRGIALTKTTLRNQNGQDVFSVQCTVMLLKRSSPGE